MLALLGANVVVYSERVFGAAGGGEGIGRRERPYSPRLAVDVNLATAGEPYLTLLARRVAVSLKIGVCLERKRHGGDDGCRSTHRYIDPGTWTSCSSPPSSLPCCGCRELQVGPAYEIGVCNNRSLFYPKKLISTML